MNSVPSVQKPIDIDDTFAQIAILYTNDEARRLIEEAYAGVDTSLMLSHGVDEVDANKGDIAYVEDAAQIPPELAPESQTGWVESNPDGTSTEHQYYWQCMFVLGNLGHALDVVLSNIDNENDMEQWAEYKRLIFEARGIHDAYKLADLRQNLTPEVEQFVLSLNIDVAEYERVSNK